MTNPVVTVTTSIPSPADPSTVRKTYMLRTFDALKFFLYQNGEDTNSIDPTKMGQEVYMIWQLQDALGASSNPDFITEDNWEVVRVSPSAFVTANKSIMPKILTPSTVLVDNGIAMERGAYSAYWDGKELFNWTLDSFNGEDIDAITWFEYAQVGANFGSQYVSVKAKDDTSETNNIVMSLKSHADYPAGDWVSTNMVGGGAFMLMLNVLGVTPGSSDPTETEKNRWVIEISFGEVVMTIADASTMKVKVGNEETTVNLAEGMAKEGPPQTQHIDDKIPLQIGVFPCWNGIMVTSGSQETPEVSRSASTYCRKLKDASIQIQPYSDWFDPNSPSDIEVDTGGLGTSTIVDTGDEITVSAKNCRFEVAYLPRFFSHSMEVDGWLLLADDTGDISYSYNIYTIYTRNGTDYHIGTPEAVPSDWGGSTEGTSYWSVTWDMWMQDSKYQRYAGEIFGYILETIENRSYSIKNGNGSFDLNWTGGTPADTDTNWNNHIKSLSVTVGIDGSSGSITVDKFGCAGTEAVAIQSVGGIVLNASGGANTFAGNIFTGIAMGVAESADVAEATWTIPLVGLEKKMEDIALINPPFVDGETLAEVVDFLCRYAGINYDMSTAESWTRLSATEEISAARFDWKTGTTVRTALEEVLRDVLHWYVVRDGVVYIYKLGLNGLPTTLGPDRSGAYSSLNIMHIDAAPDFDDLRNYVVVLALQKIPEAQGTDISTVPTFPLMEARLKDTLPDIPWAKCLVQAIPGALSQSQLSNVADNLSNMSTVYEVTGRITIPGNALIKPYDQWGGYVISSVTHNMDFQSKSWTTDLEFMKNSV